MRLPFLMCVLVLVSLPAFAQEVDGLAKPPTAAQHRSEAERADAAAVASVRPGEVLVHARTICIETKTVFFTPETLERKLMVEKDFAQLGLVIVKDPKVADLLIQIDRPLFTHQRTYTVFDPKTTVVLLTGNVRAFDGTLASGPIAKQIVAGLLKQKTDAAVKPVVSSSN
jgi:hypothetical protein